ncbi:MAG: 50S ribosomal protein L6 [Planctomycetes bacterium]|nr:50S ribosomal protein L6 [Planctomycetota bacterium]
MSRVGKKSVAIPAGVKISVSGGTVQVQGPKGSADWRLGAGVQVAVTGNEVAVARLRDDKVTRSLHGTTRQIIGNMIRGVSQGFERRLEIVGVGFNAKVEKNSLVLQVGFCHPISLPIPEGLKVEAPKPTNITIKGVDKQKVGQFAAEVRGIRPPEPYKGKGIRYENETVRRKAAKAFGTAAGAK